MESHELHVVEGSGSNGPESRVLAREHEPVLTSKERALLDCFQRRPDQALSREQLLLEVWGGLYSGGARTVDVHVCRLRAKMRGRLELQTLRGKGYQLASTTKPWRHDAT